MYCRPSSLDRSYQKLIQRTCVLFGYVCYVHVVMVSCMYVYEQCMNRCGLRYTMSQRSSALLGLNLSVWSLHSDTTYRLLHRVSALIWSSLAQSLNSNRVRVYSNLSCVLASSSYENDLCRAYISLYSLCLRDRLMPHNMSISACVYLYLIVARV